VRLDVALGTASELAVDRRHVGFVVPVPGSGREVVQPVEESAESSTLSAAVFSSTRVTLRMPGMCAMSSPRVSSQTRAVCAGVAPISAPIARTSSTMARLRTKFSPMNRGLVLRQSSSAK
jgi:hypothetical protein